MSAADDMASRHSAVLTELAGFGVELARALKDQAVAAAGGDKPEQAQGLALAFHRIARDVRLTLALESRLADERLDQAKRCEARTRLAALSRVKQVRTVVAQEIWREREGEAAEALLDELDEHLEREALFDAFVEGPVEAVIAAIRADLGLAANDGGVEAPEPEPEPGPASDEAPPPWRSWA